ncbi:MAG: RecQ family DEAD/DEAH box helicase, partial [Gemmatimonadota bacterium]
MSRMLEPHGGGLDAALHVLRERFGHEGFRPRQAEIVRAMLAGRDLLAVLPTGAGKSVCFQLPALLADRPTVVVSPLIALMQDQVAGLSRRGIDAAALTSATPRAERERLRERLAGQPPRLLYASPERLAVAGFVDACRRLRPARVVVDEAHCISEWGHDFRPDYRRILSFLEAVGRPPVAAFTATATPATRADVERCLELRSPRRFVAPVDRPNLRWAVRRDRRAGGAILRAETAAREALRRDPRAAAIVYVLSRAGAIRAAAALRRLGIPAGAYHGGMEPEARAERQEAFLGG